MVRNTSQSPIFSSSKYLDNSRVAERDPPFPVHKAAGHEWLQPLPLAFSWSFPEVQQLWPAFPYRLGISSSGRKSPSGNKRKTVIMRGKVSHQTNPLAVSPASPRQ